MTNPTNDTPDSQNTATDAPVAPEAAPAAGDAEEVTSAETTTVTNAGSDTTPDAEPVVATAAATPDLATSPAASPEPVMASTGTGAASGRRNRRDADRPKRGPVRPEGPAPLGHFAVIETGGKQYRVSVGDRIAVERLEGDAGSEITIDRVLMVGGDGSPRIGEPVLEGAAVTATIETQYRGEKLIIFKMKPKKRYRRRTGHRQNLTRLAITGITA